MTFSHVFIGSNSPPPQDTRRESTSATIAAAIGEGVALLQRVGANATAPPRPDVGQRRLPLFVVREDHGARPPGPRTAPRPPAARSAGPGRVQIERIPPRRADRRPPGPPPRAWRSRRSILSSRTSSGSRSMWTISRSTRSPIFVGSTSTSAATRSRGCRTPCSWRGRGRGSHPDDRDAVLGEPELPPDLVDQVGDVVPRLASRTSRDGRGLSGPWPTSPRPPSRAARRTRSRCPPRRDRPAPGGSEGAGHRRFRDRSIPHRLPAHPGSLAQMRPGFHEFTSAASSAGCTVISNASSPSTSTTGIGSRTRAPAPRRPRCRSPGTRTRGGRCARLISRATSGWRRGSRGRPGARADGSVPRRVADERR